MSNLLGGAVSGSGGKAKKVVENKLSKEWWNKCNHPDFSESEFRKEFRMNRSTFNIICEELSPVLRKKVIANHTPIPVRERIAVCLWKLATGVSHLACSEKFGIPSSTMSWLFQEFCSAVEKVLKPKYIQWPNEETLNKIETEFKSISRIPNVVGSMYTSHIPIATPRNNAEAHLNVQRTKRLKKASYSILVQGVVDHKGFFTDVYFGGPGKMTDEQFLLQSPFYKERTDRLKDGVWIVGNNRFPLMDGFLLVPYTTHSSRAEITFNEQIHKIQEVARETFLRLKGRWVCLQKVTRITLKDMSIVIGACCVLHNICLSNNDEIDPEWRTELYDNNIVVEPGVGSERATQARDDIAENLIAIRTFV